MLISDLPIASFDRTVDSKSLCPHHGQTCKKGLCDWRAKYAKKMERECGYPKGPSNSKNYNPRRNNSWNHSGNPPPGDSLNGGNRDGTQVPLVAHPPLVVRLPLVVMRGVAGDLPHSLPIGRINHRLRPLVRVMEPAAGDNPPGLQPAVARRPEMPALVYSRS